MHSFIHSFNHTLIRFKAWHIQGVAIVAAMPAAAISAAAAVAADAHYLYN